jgi:ribosomal protein S1
MEEMYGQTLSTVVEHDVLMGRIIALTGKEAVVNIGFKSDGLIPLSEFRHMPDLKVGDEVEVYVETQEDKNGQLILSHKKARALKSWERVNTALEKDEVITMKHISALRPCTNVGIKPYDIEKLLGRKVLVGIEMGEEITLTNTI